VVANATAITATAAPVRMPLDIDMAPRFYDGIAPLAK
jgi:hypothetical protein